MPDITLYPQAAPPSFKQAVISDSSGDFTAITHTSGKVIKVWRFRLYVGGGAGIAFESSGGTVLFPEVGFGGSGVQAIFIDPPSSSNGLWVPEFQTLLNEDLQIVLSTAASCTGTILYSLETPNP